jgi:hypothetical protein
MSGTTVSGTGRKASARNSLRNTRHLPQPIRTDLRR